ncbi:hypothetical protein, partial [Francisella tularensis]|uniref:hypothetical protein n=1 Tax=Francisella tularensis TaxID=263 RepID=UPI001C0EE57C
DQLASIVADSKKVGTQGDRLDLALLVDGLQSEREQGITIDVAVSTFGYLLQLNQTYVTLKLSLVNKI